jgi:hypothetical protein
LDVLNFTFAWVSFNPHDLRCSPIAQHPDCPFNPRLEAVSDKPRYKSCQHALKMRHAGR